MPALDRLRLEKIRWTVSVPLRHTFISHLGVVEKIKDVDAVKFSE